MKTGSVDVAERMRRVAQVWSWLPSFRAAAESAHLPTASALLGISSPALSRTLKLVEESVGIPLFDRVGRRLQLNDAGGALLVAVRNAMRLVDDALDIIAGIELVGNVRLACWGTHMTPLVLPGLRALRGKQPGIVVHVSAVQPAHLPAQLREGALDLALVDGPPQAPDLACTRLGDLAYGVYAGRGHPLHGKNAAVAEIGRYPFVAPVSGIDDRWPPEIPRTVACRLSSIHDALSLCASGDLLAVLPESLASDRAVVERLWRLDEVAIRAEPAYLVKRAMLGPQPRLDLVVAALEEQATFACVRRGDRGERQTTAASARARRPEAG